MNTKIKLLNLRERKSIYLVYFLPANKGTGTWFVHRSPILKLEHHKNNSNIIYGFRNIPFEINIKYKDNIIYDEDTKIYLFLNKEDLIEFKTKKRIWNPINISESYNPNYFRFTDKLYKPLKDISIGDSVCHYKECYNKHVPVMDIIISKDSELNIYTRNKLHSNIKSNSVYSEVINIKNTNNYITSSFAYAMKKYFIAYIDILEGVYQGLYKKKKFMKYSEFRKNWKRALRNVSKFKAIDLV